MAHFGELLTAAITPFDKEGIIKTDTFWRLCKKLVADGSDGVVLTGTTAESPNLTEEDRINIYSTAKDAIGDKANLIAGTGTYSTKESIHYSNLAEDIGMDGIMIVAPYYNKPSQLGILRHFEAIKNSTHLPIMAYNIPGRTGTLIELDTIEKLISDIGIHSIKDAVGDFEYSQIELSRFKNDVYIYSGDDALTKDFILNGGVGVVSVASHIIGKEIRQMINLLLHGDEAQAEIINKSLQPFISSIFQEPSPGPIKHLLATTWEDVGTPLLPMTEVSLELANKLNDIYNKLNN